MDHCVNAIKERKREELYRTYVTDVVKLLAEILGGTISDKYSNLIDFTPKKELTGDEVAISVITRCGLKVKNDDAIRVTSETIS